jgi:preprotein translocase subunit Sec61beta
MDNEPSKEIPARPRVGFAQTARAVLWSFFGVRRKSDYENDANQLNPIYVIITGVAAAALFVIVLIVVVNLVVR